jgi:hypothetical protein
VTCQKLHATASCNPVSNTQKRLDGSDLITRRLDLTATTSDSRIFRTSVPATATKHCKTNSRCLTGKNTISVGNGDLTELCRFSTAGQMSPRDISVSMETTEALGKIVVKSPHPSKFLSLYVTLRKSESNGSIFVQAR